jgi:hypothetical protein
MVLLAAAKTSEPVEVHLPSAAKQLFLAGDSQLWYCCDWL